MKPATSATTLAIIAKIILTVRNCLIAARKMETRGGLN
jgi:hypothetical protein